jgi:Fe-S cluster biogenesis protein NfuA
MEAAFVGELQELAPVSATVAEAPGATGATGATAPLLDAGATRARVAAVEARLDGLETLEPMARTLAFAAVQGLAGLYGEGLARIVARLVELEAAGPAGAAGPLAALLEDELVAHLFILHDLHPVGLAARVEQALDETRPYLRSHGGDAEVVRIEGGVVQLRMIGSCHGCPSSALTLRQAVETAVRRLAPEIARVEEGGAGGGAGGGEAEDVLVQLERQRA